MAKQLFEEEVNLTNTSVNSTPTSSPVIRRPNKFGNTKAGIGEFTGPQTRTVSENNPSRDELAKSFDENLVFFDENYIPNPTQTQITVSGKYSEVNYVTFNIPNLQSVRSISGNIYSGVIKNVIPNPTITDSLNDGVATAGVTNGTNGTGGVVSPQFPPFGEVGVVGEIREFLPTGQLYIFTFNYNVGRWLPYEIGQGGGAASTSGGVGATDLSGNSGGSLGGGNNDPSGGPGGNRPGQL
jgi:hypothetical protein